MCGLAGFVGYGDRGDTFTVGLAVPSFDMSRFAHRGANAIGGCFVVHAFTGAVGSAKLTLCNCTTRQELITGSNPLARRCL